MPEPLLGLLKHVTYVEGVWFDQAINGGTYFTINEAISFSITCEDQAEVDEYWDKLVKAGAKPVKVVAKAVKASRTDD